MISEKFKRWKGAVVHVKPKGDNAFASSAAHLFVTGDGFAYVAPGYFYPETSHLNNFHKITAELKDDGDRIAFSGPDYSGHIEEWVCETPQLEAAGDSLYLYEVALEEKGKTFESERAMILEAIADDLQSA